MLLKIYVLCWVIVFMYLIICNTIIEHLLTYRLFFPDCGNLTAPADGSVNFSSGTTFQSVATFECSIGYTLEGDATRTCQANESWSNSDPSCNINGKTF